MNNKMMILSALALLAGCGGGGSAVQTPPQFVGSWGADCTSPFVGFEASRIHVFPDKATYDLKSASLQGANFQISYDSAQGPVSETYVVEGATLRLDTGTYGGQQATWHKAPMSKCG
jgi:hypothetical protein